MPRCFPPARAAACKIGLFGGTFDPPHAAHRAACLIAMKRLGLDRVWWLVTPGNPLKDTRGLAPLAERIAAARALGASSAHRCHRLRGRNRRPLHLRYRALSADPLPGVRFVWIMGADNLRSFHRWQKWRAIAGMVPIAVVDRLGPSLYATAGIAGQALARARIPETRRARCRAAGRRHGSTCTASNRRCHRQRCARAPPAVAKPPIANPR